MEHVKKEIRILGIDDAPFDKTDDECLIVGTVFRGGLFLDGLLSCKVKVDGNDATKKLIHLINKSKHKAQLKVVMLDGIAVAGFNVINIKELNEKTKLPVIVIIKYLPNLPSIKKALQKFPDSEEKWTYILNAGKIYETKVHNSKIYFQIAGISEENANKIIKLSSTRSTQPEPIRVSHLIASGIIKGESRGRA